MVSIHLLRLIIILPVSYLSIWMNYHRFILIILRCPFHFSALLLWTASIQHLWTAPFPVFLLTLAHLLNYAVKFICGWFATVSEFGEVFNNIPGWGGSYLLSFASTVLSVSEIPIDFVVLHLQIDMTALVHMNDDDLKALGIPMVSFLILNSQLFCHLLTMRNLYSGHIG